MSVILLAQESTSAYDAGNAAQRETHVTQNEARAVGLRFLNANTGQTRSIGELQMVKAYRTTQNDTAFYIFNTANGFVIVSADRCATPILGYSNEGPFNTNNVPVQMQGYLQGFVEQIAYGIGHPTMVDATTTQQWQEVRSSGYLNHTRSNDHVNPLITAMWDQGCYYNAKCPEDPNGYCGGHVPTGCVATAMGMIMHYWGYPKQGNGSNSYQSVYGYPDQSVNFGETVYDWANMPDTLNENSTQSEIDAVSRLLWHCGVSVYMIYEPNAASAYDKYVINALTHFFNYSDELTLQDKTYDYIWTQQIKDNLDLGRPVYYSGNDANGGGGHAFVCDGYDENDLLHFNWGWGGSGNGYFASGSLNVGGYEYNYGNAAIFNIVPKCDGNSTFTVAVDVNQPVMGNISGGGVFDCGEKCTLTASSNAGYQFDYWTENGVFVSSDSNYSFNVTSDCSLEAHFSPLSHTVEASSNPAQCGNISGITNTKTVFYDNGTYSDAISGGGPGYWAMRVPHDSLVGMEGKSLTKVSVFDNTTYSGELMIYTTDNWMYGDDIQAFGLQGQLGEELVYQQRFELHGTMKYVDINLATPIQVNSSTNLFIVLHNYSGEFVASFSDYCGNPICSYWSSNNSTWYNMITMYHIDLTWMIRAHFSSEEPNIQYVGTDFRGDFYDGDTCTLSAVPNASCSFVGWTENGIVLSTDSIYSFPVTQNRHLNANFTFPCSINVTIDPIAGGMVTGGGTYNYGDTCVLFASPSTNEGYQFYYWEENGQAVSTDTVYSFVAQNNRHLVAHFGFPLNVTVIANPDSGGVVSGTGTFGYGDTCTVTASANQGYLFKYWTINGLLVSANESYSFAVVANTDIIAHFSIPSSTIIAVAQPEQGGTVRGNTYHEVIAYDNGSCAYITGIVIGDQSFSWGVMFPDTMLSDLAGSYLTKVKLYDYSPFYGQFLIFQGGDNSPGELLCQQDFTVLGTYSFVEIPLVNPIPIDTTKNLWIIINAYEVGDNPFIAALSEYTGNPNGGWFSYDGIEWEQREVSYMIRGIVESLEPNAMINHQGQYWGGEFENGLICTLKAVPKEGCTFVNWVENGTIVSTDTSYSFVVSDSRYLRANFIFPCSINASVIPLSTGTVTGTGTYMYGDSCTLTAMAGEGYSFVNWTENDIEVSSDSTYTFIVTTNRDLVANFAEPFTIVASVNSPNIGTVTGSGTYGYGASCTLIPTPSNGYVFHKWVENGEVISFDSTYTFTVTGDRNIVAYFAPEGSLCNIVFDMSWDYWTDLGLTVNYGDGTTEHLYDTEHGGNISFLRPVMDNSHVFLSEAIGQHFILYIHYENGYPFYCSSDHYTLDIVNAMFEHEFDVDCEGGNNTYSITVDIAPTDGGIVTGAGEYQPYQTCTLTAIPNEGYIFAYWSDAETDNPRTITVTNDMNFTAYFVPCSDTVEFAETACERFEWNGEFFTNSGDYTRTFTNANGCDSMVTLRLTINQPTTGIDVQTACDSFTWIDGITYTESNNTTTYTLTNAMGCDSMVTLNLTINQPVASTSSVTACDSYEWNGQTYTTSGDYTQTLTNASECDSVVTLHLTINPIETSEFSITTPDSCYEWNSETYCTSGDYTQTLQTVHGCDSTVTLHLTITVGIDDHNLGASMTVYPNPTTGVVNVQCTMTTVQAEAVEFQLFDAFGKLVNITNVGVFGTQGVCDTPPQNDTHGSSVQTQIDLSHYAAGIYFVKAVADGNVVAVRKVVKR